MVLFSRLFYLPGLTSNRSGSKHWSLEPPATGCTRNPRKIAATKTGSDFYFASLVIQPLRKKGTHGLTATILFNVTIVMSFNCWIGGGPKYSTRMSNSIRPLPYPHGPLRIMLDDAIWHQMFLGSRKS